MKRIGSIAAVAALTLLPYAGSSTAGGSTTGNIGGVGVVGKENVGGVGVVGKENVGGVGVVGVENLGGVGVVGTENLGGVGTTGSENIGGVGAGPLWGGLDTPDGHLGGLAIG